MAAGTRYAKGASEIILSRCTSYVTTAGETQALTAEESKRLETEVISPFADDAMRTIGLACAARGPRSTDKRWVAVSSLPSIEPETRLAISVGVFVSV